MHEFPDPLVPKEVDLRDFYFMPLDVGRLRDSRLAYAASGEGFRSAVLLWCACWHQLPAASLPDDDIELAHLAGFGRVVSEWLLFKEEALHGFIKCSDGRIYHPHIANEAMKSWQEKQTHRWARECDRIRKENKSRKDKNIELLPLPDKPIFPTERINIPPESVNILTETTTPITGNPTENPLKGQGKGQGQGKIKDIVVVDASAREKKADDEIFEQPVLSQIPKQPTDALQWVQYFVNHLGFQIHDAQTSKTIPMFVEWVGQGVSVAVVEMAELDVRNALAKKGDMTGRPNSPVFYKNFVAAQMFEAQKSPGDRTSQNQGLPNETKGGEKYDRKPRISEETWTSFDF